MMDGIDGDKSIDKTRSRFRSVSNKISYCFDSLPARYFRRTEEARISESFQSEGLAC